MEFKKLIKYFFVFGSAYFTALGGTLLLLLSVLTNENTSLGVEPSRFLILLAFCFVMSLGSTVRRASVVSSTLGWICNAVCYVGGCFAFCLAFNFKIGTAAILTIVFACIYAPVAIFIAMRDRKKRGGSLLNGEKKVAARTAKGNSNVKAGSAKRSETSKKDNSTYQNLFS